MEKLRTRVAASLFQNSNLRFEKAVPGSGFGLSLVLFPTMTPSTPDALTAAHMLATYSSVSSSRPNFIITAGLDLRSTDAAAPTPPVRILVRDSAY